MTTMYPCERVDLSFIAAAPFRFSNSVDLAITPEQVFEVLADANSWPQWAKVITNVTRTSPEPYGVGTTRTVDMRGALTGDEEFLAWEPYSYLAFRFNSCSNKAVAAFADSLRGGTHLGRFDLGRVATLARDARGSDSNGYRAEFVQLVGPQFKIQPWQLELLNWIEKHPGARVALYSCRGRW